MATSVLTIVVGVSATPLPIDEIVVDAVHDSRLDALEGAWRFLALAGGSAGLGAVLLGLGWVLLLAVLMQPGRPAGAERGGRASSS